MARHVNLVDEVEQILRAQESAGWMVGDLIVKEKGSNTDKVEDYLRNDLTVRLEARGLDIEYERLRAYYRTALRNPPEVRNGVSFTAAEEAGDHADRFKWYAKHGAALGKRQVRRLRGDRKLDTAATSKHASTEERVSAAKDWASDPKFLQSLLSDPDISVKVTAAYAAVTEENRNEAERRMGQHGFGGIERAGKYFDAYSNLSHILQRSKSTLDILNDLDGLSAPEINRLLNTAKKADAALQFVVARLSDNVQSMDDELFALLEED